MPVLSSPTSLLTRIRALHTADPRRARAVFLSLLAVVVLAMSVKYLVKISKPGDTGQQSRSAFLRWRSMINGVFAGENIYVEKNEYPNPPVMAVVLRPFAALPPVPGAMAWFYAKVLMAVLAAVWAFRLVGTARPHATSLDLARAAAIVLCLQPLLGDLSHNNVNIFILFLVAAALEAFRRRLDTLAGLTLALAVACKLTPALFIGYFVWKRCWRVVGASVVGLGLWLAVVPALAFGPDRTEELMRGWYALMVERPLLKGEITTEHPNQAVVGVVYRLLTHSPSYIEYVKTPEGDIPVPGEYHNLADIGRPAAWVIVKALTAFFALAVVWLCRHPIRGPADSRTGWRVAAEFSLIFLGMLLFSERTWKHHAVVLLLPFAVLTYAVAAVELPRWVRTFVTVALAASFVLMVSPGLFGGRAADLALVYGTHAAAFLLLTAAVGLLLACRSDRMGESRALHAEAIPK